MIPLCLYLLSLMRNRINIFISNHHGSFWAVGRLRGDASNARLRAKSYLEFSLPKIKDPYALAITAYALIMAKSVESEVAFALLHRARRENGEMVLLVAFFFFFFGVFFDRVTVGRSPTNYL